MDQLTREQALNPHQSFIVQAPAGSGKTELLVRRFLTLLANVTAPEEIIAITFTRKAAQEMRQRVLDALRLAEGHALAQAALQQDQRYQWHLLKNPQRLRIQTMDSLCAHLVRRMPILSGLGPSLRITENATEFYSKASQLLFASLEEENTYAGASHTDALGVLLLHVDNRMDQLETLFVHMLQKRDQWLPHMIAHRHTLSPLEFRELLENALKNIVTEMLVACHETFPMMLQQELLTLFNFASLHLKNKDPNSVLSQCGSLTQFPLPIPENQTIWLAICELLMTQKNQWRLMVDARIGFPATDKNTKQRMMDLLHALWGQDKLLANLQTLREGPSCVYTETQWQALAAMSEILPLLAAQLSVLFREYNTADFCEVSQAAQRALEESPLNSTPIPTDLALILDAQLKHILVDEFQDTSITQFRLLEKLTSGWQKEDGRTLFLVGDPMQSIYRFREAEVGLFLKAQQEGIGDVFLQPLTLTTNFRSTPAIVTWINTQFTQLFPDEENISLGAVPFTPSTTIDSFQGCEEKSVFLYPMINDTQGTHIVNIIKNASIENPQQSIAILVRARHHLRDIIPILQQNNLSFHAVEIEPLSQQIIVRDLFILTSALLHVGDRLAWLALLRAPWCGLTLNDLHAIASQNHTATVWDLIRNALEQDILSEDGRKRLMHIIPALETALLLRDRMQLRAWIERTWHALGGHYCVQNPAQMHSVASFFDLLEAFESDKFIVDLTALEKKLEECYTSPTVDTQCNLHVMTIHKAKGLEFDTVIIPHLEQSSKNDNAQLLLWFDRPRAKSYNDLIFAPMKAKQDKSDVIYDYLRRVEKTKAHFEMTRLLYVAITRAKSAVHLLAHVAFHKNAPYKNESVTPEKNTLLSLLWPAFKPAAEALNIQPIQNEEPTKSKTTPPILLKRIATPFLTTPTIEEPCTFQEKLTAPSNPITNFPAQIQHHYEASIGTVIHRCLQQITRDGIEAWNSQKIYQQHKHWEMALLQLGTSADKMKAALNTIAHAINTTLRDPRGRWILKSHTEQQSEYAITTLINDMPTALTIDRTFVDEDNIRWIIDYKTTGISEPYLEKPDIFMAHAQQLHKAQLERYALAISHLDNRPIQLGLYFPMFAGWIAWTYKAITVNPGID